MGSWLGRRHFLPLVALVLLQLLTATLLQTARGNISWKLRSHYSLQHSLCIEPVSQSIARPPSCLTISASGLHVSLTENKGTRTLVVRTKDIVINNSGAQTVVGPLIFGARVGTGSDDTSAPDYHVPEDLQPVALRDVLRRLSQLFLFPESVPLAHADLLLHCQLNRDDGRGVTTRRTVRKKCANKRLPTADRLVHDVYSMTLEQEILLDEDGGVLAGTRLSETLQHGSSLAGRAGGVAFGERIVTRVVLMADDSSSSISHTEKMEEGSLNDIPIFRFEDWKRETMPAVTADLLEKEIRGLLAQESVADPLTIVSQIRKLLSKSGGVGDVLTVDTALRVLKKVRKMARFHLVLDAAAASGQLAVHTAVMKLLPPGPTTAKLLERYLIALSFAPKVDPGVLGDLQKRPFKDHPGLAETATYTVCQQSRGGSRAAQKKVLDWVRASEADCSASTDCQRKLVNCIGAMRSVSDARGVLEIGRTAKDQQLRELALTVLARLERTSLELEHGLHDWLALPELRNSELFQLAELVEPETLLSRRRELFAAAGGAPERQCYLAQKLGSQLPSVRRDYGTLSYAAQGQSVYVAKQLTESSSVENQLSAGFSFATCMAGAALTRTSFNLWTRDGSANQQQSLLTIHSFIGGLSGLIGQAEPGDDPEANASLFVSLLGLPLRPMVLFTSIGDLIEMYWSGALQDKTTLLEGAIPLMEQSQEWVTAGGIRVRFTSSASLYLQSTGSAEISIWTSSGSGGLNTEATVEAKSGAELIGGGDDDSGKLKIGSQVRIETGLSVDTQVRMGGELVACVKMMTSQLVVKHRHLDGSHDPGPPLWATWAMPGVTWNLNQRNNQMCNSL